MSFTNITQEMRDITDDIMTENLMVLTKMVWVHVKDEMDRVPWCLVWPAEETGGGESSEVSC